jgi:hypothetical protein
MFHRKRREATAKSVVAAPRVSNVRVLSTDEEIQAGGRGARQGLGTGPGASGPGSDHEEYLGGTDEGRRNRARNRCRGLNTAPERSRDPFSASVPATPGSGRADRRRP